ncbi:carotenoid oxygenase family protein [soil metagenome]
MSVTEQSTSRYLRGNFAPVAEERTAFDLPITGTLPAQLDGRYLRIGPNPITPPDPATYHWFTGDGMVHGVRLRDGRAEWYRNRFVRSTRVSEHLGEEPAPGVRHGMGDGANTNVIGHAGGTFAIVEAGSRPVELTYELDTVAHSDFGGTLPNGFTAHPKRDPLTGELHAVAYYWELPHVQYLVIGPDGRVRKTEPIETKGSPMMHDMSLTGRHAVFYDMPVTFNLDAAMAGGAFPYRWDDAYGARVGVMPREGTNADVAWFEVDPCYVFHPLNAFDDGDRIVLDVIRHPSVFADDLQGPNDGPPTLWRWTVDQATGTVNEEQLDDRPQEFPRVDERVVGGRHRYGYSVGVTVGERFDLGGELVKHDLAAGTSETHQFGVGTAVGESVFVPRSADATEDDGWVMAFVYDAATDRSDLAVLDAGDFGAEPVARVHLPARVPHGFHGNWVPDPSA